MKWAIIALVFLSIALVACAQGSNTAGEASMINKQGSTVKLALNGDVQDLKVGETFSITAPKETEINYELTPVFISDGAVKTAFNGWMTPPLREGQTITTPEGIEFAPVYITKSSAKYIVQGDITPELQIKQTYTGTATISGVCEATVLHITP